MKTCSRCHINKSIDCFNKSSRLKDGLQTWCRDCYKSYNLENFDVLSEKKRVYKKKDPEKWSNYHAQYDEIHKDKKRRQRRDSMRRKRATDFTLLVKDRLRARLSRAIKHQFKSGSAVRDLGCTILELKAHLESKFQPGMTWDNWGKGKGKWNIDHVIPLAAFNLSDRQHIILACYYLNLQPLWFEDNVRKRDLF
ncbi:MAG: hypothetical protein KGL39_58945 [Patescibacteria group bacterium]|nr:hypothetical protein [Patescibacteria group bacterium]